LHGVTCQMTVTLSRCGPLSWLGWSLISFSLWRSVFDHRLVCV